MLYARLSRGEGGCSKNHLPFAEGVGNLRLRSVGVVIRRRGRRRYAMWLGQSCPSSSRRRGRRRYAMGVGQSCPSTVRRRGRRHSRCGLDSPVQAVLVGGDTDATRWGVSSAVAVVLRRVRRHSCRRGSSWRGRFATPRKASHPQRVAWTFLSKRCSSARTPTLRVWGFVGGTPTLRWSAFRRPSTPVDHIWKGGWGRKKQITPTFSNSLRG